MNRPVPFRVVFRCAEGRVYVRHHAPDGENRRVTGPYTDITDACMYLCRFWPDQVPMVERGSHGERRVALPPHAEECDA